MKKILYMELLDNNYGNKHLDINIISSLVKFANVTVSYYKGFFETVPIGAEEVVYERPQCPYFWGKRIRTYWIHFKHMLVAANIIRRGEFDTVVFASYHNIMMLLCLLFRNKVGSIYIMSHNNLDNLSTSAFGKFIFGIYSKKVNHIVFADFIADYLESEYNIPKDRIISLPHPLNITEHDDLKLYDCVGISNSNDESWIEKLIELEKKEGVLSSSGNTVILRSKIHEYRNKGLIVIKGYLSDEDYYQYINHARSIFLPFPTDFRYRMSGSIVDAFSSKSKVIGSRIPLFMAFEHKYPAICKTVVDVNEFIEVITAGRNVSNINEEEQFCDFLELHSQERILNMLKARIDCI